MYRVYPTRPPDTGQATTPAPPSGSSAAVTSHLPLDDDFLRTDSALVVNYRLKQIYDQEGAEERSEDRSCQGTTRVLS